jgi:hypothetical protein
MRSVMSRTRPPVRDGAHRAPEQGAAAEEPRRNARGDRRLVEAREGAGEPEGDDRQHQQEREVQLDVDAADPADSK